MFGGSVACLDGIFFQAAILASIVTLPQKLVLNMIGKLSPSLPQIDVGVELNSKGPQRHIGNVSHCLKSDIYQYQTNIC